MLGTPERDPNSENYPSGLPVTRRATDAAFCQRGGMLVCLGAILGRLFGLA